MIDRIRNRTSKSDFEEQTARNLADGSIAWKSPVAGQLAMVPAVDAERVDVGTQSGAMLDMYANRNTTKIRERSARIIRDYGGEARLDALDNPK